MPSTFPISLGGGFYVAARANHLKVWLKPHVETQKDIRTQENLTRKSAAELRLNCCKVTIFVGNFELLYRKNTPKVGLSIDRMLFFE